MPAFAGVGENEGMLEGLVGLAIAMSLWALRGHRARIRFIEEKLGERPRRTPPATVIVPVKGEDDGLRENLAALASLDYPDYELIVAARAPEDIPEGVVPEKARVVIAGECPPGMGEKVHNLTEAVRGARASSEVLAFADSDGRVPPGWLKALVAALERPRAGAATGYRHYLPEPPDFPSLLRAVWNGVIEGTLGPDPAPLAWGGAMAMRRKTFEAARVLERWRNTVSDDYALAAAVRATGLDVVYAPGAAVVTAGRTGWRELFAWIRRQLVLTRVYRPELWAGAFAGHLVYCAAMAVSAWWVFAGNLTGVYTLIGQVAPGLWKGRQRLQVMMRELPGRRRWWRRHGWAHVGLVPLGTWVWMAGLVLSASSNVIEWRGRRYRLTAGRVETL